MALHVKGGGFPKTLRHVHIVPVRDTVCPIDRFPVHFLSQLKQSRIPGTVVQPIHAVQEVASAVRWPVPDQEFIFRDGFQVVEIACHQPDHTLVV